MSYDGSAFTQHSVLSPPLVAAIDSEHIFGSCNAASTSRAASDRIPNEPPLASSQPRRNRSRASSTASIHNLGTIVDSANSSLQQHGQRRTRRSNHDRPGHSRSGSRSGHAPTPGRAGSSACDDLRPLTSSLRNRSTPHLDGLRSLSAAHEHVRSNAAPSAFTAPSSPLLSSAASLALAMSPVAQAFATSDHLTPSEWTLDNSAPTSPRSSYLSRNASDYFDPALLAQLQSSQNGSSHPELRTNTGRPDPSPPLDTVLGRLSPHLAPPARSASQSEWAQHAAHMQQTAQLLGLQRLFASRSTPHLPDLDSGYVGHEFESPPPYAPRASALETELERAADLFGSSAPAGMSNSSSASTLLNASDPPLPPPISIPSSGGASGPPSARPSLRARSNSRGSRSGPPSPSASFFGRRGLTSLSPFPAGLEMTPSIAHAPQFSSTPASPSFAPDSDGDEDVDGALSFSSSRSKQRRDERRQTVAGIEGAGLSEDPSTSLPGSSTLSRRRRSGSAGSARQLLRPRTPIHSAAPREAQVLPNGNANVSAEVFNARSPSPLSQVRSATPISNGHSAQQAPSSRSQASSPNDADHTDGASSPLSPTSDTTHQPDSPSSPETRRSSAPFLPNASHSSNPATNLSGAAPCEKAEEEEFPQVLKLLLHPLRILAAVPGCIGTFWLARNALLLFTLHGHLLSPGPFLLSSAPLRVGRRQPGSLDFFIACLWSLSTAYHALSFTTLLLRRWLLYYSILPSLIRLVALQAICWPLVRLTVHVFGADQPLGAWVVIGTTTALSDVVSRWVTSNIADAPLDDEVDEEEEGVVDEGVGEVSDWDPRSGDESDAAAMFVLERERQRKQRRGGQGTRFWRAVIGGPSFASRRRRKLQNPSAGTETEMEAESDWPGYGTDRTALGSEGLRRRFEPSPRDASAGVGVRGKLPPFPLRRPASYRQGNFRYVLRAGTWQRERASSRRNFHWEVAVWRNVVPIAVLSYLSMWVLIADAMRLGA